MADYTPTADIMKRVEAALEFDLLGQTGASGAVDSDANGDLDPLNSTPVCETVDRYLIDVVAAGDIYAQVRGTGIAVGYSFGQDIEDLPVTGTGASIGRIVPVEVSVIAVVTQMDDLIGSERGEQVDDVMDDVKRVFGGKRRDGTNFSVQNVNVGTITKLDGGTRDAPWHGRTLPVQFRRSDKALHV